MRFNPRADISTGGVSDAGAGSGRAGLPLPTSAGGGKAGIVLMLLGLLVRFLLSRRRTATRTR